MAKVRAKTSSGVRQSWVARGLVFKLSAIASSSSWVYTDRSVPLGSVALERWQDVPSAKICHPRPEYLLPLMVAAGRLTCRESAYLVGRYWRQ